MPEITERDAIAGRQAGRINPSDKMSDGHFPRNEFKVSVARLSLSPGAVPRLGSLLAHARATRSTPLGSGVPTPDGPPVPDDVCRSRVRAIRLGVDKLTILRY